MESNDDYWEFYQTEPILRQDYLINFQRGLLKSPKIQYFVLLQSGLVALEDRPGKTAEESTNRLAFLPHAKLTSITVDYMELDSCKLSCMQLTSKTGASFTVAFKSREERDDWMMLIMRNFSEALVEARALEKPTSDSEDEHEQLECRGSHAQTSRPKRRRKDAPDGGSTRRWKSVDVLASPEVTDTASCIHEPRALTSCDFPNDAERASRKRKSEPDVIADVTSLCRSNERKQEESVWLNSSRFEHRDSLEVQAKKQIANMKKQLKGNGVFARFLMRLETIALNPEHVFSRLNDLLQV